MGMPSGLAAAVVLMAACGSPLNRKAMNMNTVWGNQVSGQALSIRTEQAAFRAGEPILLNLTLKNFGQNPVVAVVRSPWLDYDIQVREASGSTVPHTEFAANTLALASATLRVVLVLLFAFGADCRFSLTSVCCTSVFSVSLLLIHFY